MSSGSLSAPSRHNCDGLLRLRQFARGPGEGGWYGWCSVRTGSYRMEERRVSLEDMPEKSTC